MQGGDRVGLAQAERPEVGGLGLGGLAVDLVGAEHGRLAGPADDLDQGLVGVGGTDGGVDHEQHRVGLLDTQLGLGGDHGVDAEDVDLPAAGVDDLEAAAVPGGLVADAVAGDAGLVLDDGLATADDAVDQGRLADVRAADDGQHRKRGVGAVAEAVDVVEVEALLGGERHELGVVGGVQLAGAGGGVLCGHVRTVRFPVRPFPGTHRAYLPRRGSANGFGCHRGAPLLSESSCRKFRSIIREAEESRSRRVGGAGPSGPAGLRPSTARLRPAARPAW